VTVTKPQCQLINHFSGFLLGRLFDHPAHPSLPDRQPGLHDGLQTIVGTNFDFRREDQTTGNEKKVKTIISKQQQAIKSKTIRKKS
jgi:hypothetical protein